MRAFAATRLTGLLLASAGCRRDLTAPEPAGSAQVTVDRTADGLRLGNATDRPIAYTVFERGYLALFAPCLDPGPGCLRLAPGASAVVPYAEIGGYSPGAREAIVYWWHLVPDGAGGYRAEEIHSVISPL